MTEKIPNKNRDSNPIEITKNIVRLYPICPECLGRQFALLGTNMANSERAESLLNTIIMQIHNDYYNMNQAVDQVENQDVSKELALLTKIAENTTSTVVKPLLRKLSNSYTESKAEFHCAICNNVFLQTNEIIDKIIEQTREFEFSNFLIGTSINPIFQEKEDEFRVKLNITTGEAFKKNLNRLVGIELAKKWDLPVEFKEPEVNIIIDLDLHDFKIDIVSNPLCVQGRYHKYERGIPQTHWPHRACHGKGCKECNVTGKQYPTSVEELLTPFIQKYSLGTDSKFHGAGREDIDARCLGNGRPFIIEIKEPKKRSLDLQKIENEIKEQVGKRVDAINLKFVPRSKIKKIKSRGEKTRKSYRAFIESKNPITKEEFEEKFNAAKKQVIGKTIYQRTPTRVAHRRADKTREKEIYKLNGEWIDELHIIVDIEAMGGTYIKEFISSDNQRTTPNLSSLLDRSLTCENLDVTSVKKITNGK
ncbi:MAG: tRNA pseudouridine(54/55) synthase Pus10 [Candidatus Lokiarchaeota archaeon]|nr:tRNA pseudouridine(54/55) synthase Pus10 [Candidatus Lokiarchaeota archaeon]